MDDTVAVFVVTYRRPKLLARAVKSVLDQSHRNLIVRVVNDDPEDVETIRVVGAFNDSRVTLYEPQARRGGAANFNLAFAERDCQYATLLEDDNWWAPTFLSRMLEGLTNRPDVALACANERLWSEIPGGEWRDTGANVWPFRDEQLYSTDLETACGSARICNSSMLFRTLKSKAWLTPDDIPIDVTEHFRERLIPQPVLLVGEPLVNYAQTLQTYRNGANVWAEYQTLLIASVFAALPAAQRNLAAQVIWQRLGRFPRPKATSMLIAAIACPVARPLLWNAPLPVIARFTLTVAARFPQLLAQLDVVKRRRAHWEFLVGAAQGMGITMGPLGRVG